MNGLKEAFSRENLLKNLNFFVLLNLGLVLTAVGIVYFKNPNHFAFGGTSGLSILLADLFPRINVGGFMWIINIVLVVLGFIFLGIKCMGWTIYSSFALSFFVSGCEWLYPSGVSLSGDAMLDLVFAVFLPALGAAIVFDIGASTGGTDIVALILAKYTSMEIGKALMVSDILIVLAAAVRFGMGTGLYCILGLIGKSFVVDGAIENIRLRKVCTIMTANPQPILDFIIHNMNRSATVEKAYGAYTHHELSVLVTVLTRRLCSCATSCGRTTPTALSPSSTPARSSARASAPSTKTALYPFFIHFPIKASPDRGKPLFRGLPPCSVQLRT